MTGKSTEPLKQMLSELVVYALKDPEWRGNTINVKNIRIVKMRGKSVSASYLFDGYVLKKEEVTKSKYAGSEGVLLLQGALKPKDSDAKVEVNTAKDLEDMLTREQAEQEAIIAKLIDHNVGYVFTTKDISDEVAAHMGRHGILGWRRISDEELQTMQKLTGGTIISRWEDISSMVLGVIIGHKEEQHEEETYFFFSSPHSEYVKTIVIQGSSDYILDETERAFHDAMATVVSVLEDHTYLCGGGSSYMAMAKEVLLRMAIGSRESYAMEAFAKALKAIPKQLAENSGMDPIDTMLQLEAAHKDSFTMGVNVLASSITDMVGIYEPYRLVKTAITGATETASMILRIDDVIQAKGLDPEEAVRIQAAQRRMHQGG